MVIVIELNTENMFTSEFDDEDYETEVLCANWNPDLTSLSGSVTTYEQQFTGVLPVDLVEADVDNFLSRMYLCQE